MTPGLTGLVVAGGQSRRMAPPPASLPRSGNLGPEAEGSPSATPAGGGVGRDKAFLPWGHTTLIEHVIERLQPVTDELIVAVKDARRFRHLQARVVEDEVPNAHALGGLYTGLRAATTDLCFACGCDAPFLQPGVIAALVDLADGFEAVIPCDGGRLHPLHAIYRRTVIPVVEAQVRAGVWNLSALVDRLRARVVDVGAQPWRHDARLSLFNVNTPDDFRRARAFNLSAWDPTAAA